MFFDYEFLLSVIYGVMSQVSASEYDLRLKSRVVEKSHGGMNEITSIVYFMKQKQGGEFIFQLYYI